MNIIPTFLFRAIFLGLFLFVFLFAATEGYADSKKHKNKGKDKGKSESSPHSSCAGDCDDDEDDKGHNSREDVKGGLKICLTQGGNLVVRGQCKERSGEMKLDAESLALLSDTSLSGVPSGKTITGVLSAQFHASAASTWSISASLPAKLTTNLTTADVIVAASQGLISACGTAADCLSTEEINATSACTGTAASPTAPTGKVCIYPLAAANASNIIGVPVPTQGGKYGFAVNWQTSGLGQTQFGAVWAFKAQ